MENYVIGVGILPICVLTEVQSELHSNYIFSFQPSIGLEGVTQKSILSIVFGCFFSNPSVAIEGMDQPYFQI